MLGVTSESNVASTDPLAGRLDPGVIPDGADWFVPTNSTDEMRTVVVSSVSLLTSRRTRRAFVPAGSAERLIVAVFAPMTVAAPV